ncbi:MAG: cysteine--tRNA ligase [Candidatus Firestonebacteria bacterium]|nr:cysteine--tRNA ligase [Candidatus Firestonebacteria bacterium]
MIKIYNTLTQKKEEFLPLAQGKVKIYNCGPTVYGYFHIGNARNFIVVDVIRRYLAFRGFEVILVQNVTDVDDKIINKARAEKQTPSAVGETFTKAYFEDLEALGVKLPDINPKATEHIKEMHDIIGLLIEKGAAYASEGDVYMDVSKVKDYGKLSHKNIEELQSGARIAVSEKKKSPLDFVLWKKDKGEGISWDSPWGKGRPGWHTECCVMSQKYLEHPFDIHSGGIDLVFPHHENEIAQVETATGKKLANYWVHNGHLNIGGEKMSKSLNNFLLARDILKKYNKNIIRFFLLSAHYRSPLDFTEENVSHAVNGFSELGNTLYRVAGILKKSLAEGGAADDNLAKKGKALEEKFVAAMDDDFNTALAIAALFDYANEIKNTIKKKEWNLNHANRGALKIAGEKLAAFSTVLGFKIDAESIPEEIEALALERETARNTKDWAKSDLIRKMVEEKGFAVEDNPKGQIIMRKIK